MSSLLGKMTLRIYRGRCTHLIHEGKRCTMYIYFTNPTLRYRIQLQRQVQQKKIFLPRPYQCCAIVIKTIYLPGPVTQYACHVTYLAWLICFRSGLLNLNLALIGNAKQTRSQYTKQTQHLFPSNCINFSALFVGSDMNTEVATISASLRTRLIEHA